MTVLPASSDFLDYLIKQTENEIQHISSFESRKIPLYSRGIAHRHYNNVVKKVKIENIKRKNNQKWRTCRS